MLKKDKINWTFLSVVSLGSFVTGIYRDGFSALFPFIQVEFNLGRAQMGYHATCFLVLSTLAAVFSGRFVDLKGSKKAMIYGISSMGVFVLLHSIAPTYPVILVLAALTGAGVSVNIPAAGKGINRMISKEMRGTVTGIWSTAFPLGGLFAAFFLPSIAVFWGWRGAIFFPGILAFLATYLVFTFFPDMENEKKDLIKREAFFHQDFMSTLKNMSLLVFCCYGFFIGIVNASISAHFTLFLFLDCGLNEYMAGLGFGMMHIGSIVGRPFWTYLCDRFFQSNKSKGFLTIGFFFFFIALLIGLFLPKIAPPLILLYGLAFFTGFSGRGFQGLYFAMAPELVKEEAVGTASGLSMFFLRFGMMIGPPFVGFIADRRGSYDFSWILMGLIMVSFSLAQYLFLQFFSSRSSRGVLRPLEERQRG